MWAIFIYAKTKKKKNSLTGRLDDYGFREGKGEKKKKRRDESEYGKGR